MLGNFEVNNLDRKKNIPFSYHQLAFFVLWFRQTHGEIVLSILKMIKKLSRLSYRTNVRVAATEKYNSLRQMRGVSSMTDETTFKKVAGEFDQLTGGPYTGVNKRITALNHINLKFLSDPYVVGAVPKGVPCYLCTDENGCAFLNGTDQTLCFQQSKMFQVDDKYRVRISGANDGFLTKTVCYGKMVQNGNEIIFVMEDVFVCNGVDVSSRGIQERIAYFEVRRDVHR